MQHRVRAASIVGLLVIALGATHRPAAKSAARHPTSHEEVCGPLMRQTDTKDISDSVRDWDTWDIPEFQDQQRFVGSNAATADYGPLACVVASPYLSGVPQAAFDSPAGVMVAMAWVRFDSMPVNASYRRLHMDNPAHPFSCVIVRRRTTGAGNALTGMSVPTLNPTNVASSGRWEGFIVPSINRQCSSIDGQAPLPGSRMTSEQMTAELIPAVARFMIDRGWRPGIGVRCGAAWCTVGFQNSDHLEPAHGYGPSGVDVAVSRRAVPGWFDDQHLAVPGLGGLLGIRPRLHASIVPDTALDSLHLADFDAGWKPVATVHFRRAPSAPYSTVWGFREGGHVGNLIELRRIDSANVRVWRVRINGMVMTNLRVVHTPHPATSIHVPGTARWAWSDGDELIWVRCDQGCCKIEPT